MEKSQKAKIILGLFYLIFVSSFLYFIFSKFTIQELTSYEFIKNIRDYFYEYKKQPTLEVSEDFPQGKSTSNKLCTVLPTVVFTISISFCHYSCLFKINQSILYFAIFKIRPSEKIRPSIFGTQVLIFFKSANKLKNPP